MLREYLEEAEGLPARERTSSELLWALPPRLSEGGLRRRLQETLWQADLVKFARARPGGDQAAAYLRRRARAADPMASGRILPLGAADAVR